ncbi:hypothetical protein H5410_056030, partial [Solanum commersonii]
NFDAAVTWQSHVTPRGSGWNSRFKNKCFKRLTSREFRGESSGDLGNARGGFWGSIRRPFGGEKIRYRELEHAWSAFR